MTTTVHPQRVQGFHVVGHGHCMLHILGVGRFNSLRNPPATIWHSTIESWLRSSRRRARTLKSMLCTLFFQVFLHFSGYLKFG